MCGVAGYVLAHGRADQATVERMCDQIRYRGPDDSGYYVNGRCALGMRRLSIIDLAGGHQPIPNEDQTLWVVYNGEVYNYQELHRDLAGRGHRFATHSDTETLLHLHEEEGVSGLPRLRGMFAYALWDSRRDELLLVRDRFGKKPLYYSHTSNGLFFGSEIKCLRAAGIPLPTDPDALKLYFLLGYIPEPYSAYQSVRKLDPGSWLLYRADGTVTSGRYWNMPEPESRDRADFSLEDTCQRLRETFDEAVKMRLIADVPLGAFLSGGIDSSLVVASMARQSSDPVKTFSIGFEESEYNELQICRAGGPSLQAPTTTRNLMVRPDSVSLGRKIWSIIFGRAPSPIPPRSPLTWSPELRRAARIQSSVIQATAAMSSSAATRASRPSNPLLWHGSRSHPSCAPDSPQVSSRLAALFRVRQKLSAHAEPVRPHGSLPSRTICSNYYLRQQLLQPEWMLPADYGFLLRMLPDAFLPLTADPVSQALYFETAVNLPGAMLPKVDRMSMAASLEVRCPLLDRDLADLAASIPNSWKMRGGQGKYILLKALGDTLPPELLTRKKMGFGVPSRSLVPGSIA